jgi:hypothetical protein
VTIPYDIGPDCHPSGEPFRNVFPRPEADVREPGYCVFGCGFRMVTPVPGRSGGICGNCAQAGRADLPPGPDRPRYAPRITGRQRRRMQRTAAEFWSYGDEDEAGSPFGAFFISGHRLRRFLLMLRGKG